MQVTTVIYGRQSLTGEDSESLDYQLAQGKLQAKSHGLKVVAEMLELPSTSGYKDRGRSRPKWQQLIELVRTGRTQTIVVLNTSRLSRGGGPGYAALMEAAEEAGLDTDHFVLAGGQWMTEFMLGIWAAVDREHSKGLSARMKDLRATQAERGTFMGGTKPFGYAIHDKTHPGIPKGTAVVIEDEANELRAAARDALARKPFNHIAKDWNARLVGGRETWNATRIRVLLINPRYAALRVHQGEVVGPATWEPILTMEDHLALVALSAGRKRGKRPPRSRSLLGGLLFCARCNHSLSHQSSGWYSCAQGGGGCGSVSIKESLADEAIEEDFLALVRAPEFLKSLDPPATPATAPLIKELRAADRRLEEIATAYGKGDLSSAEHRAARSPARARKEEAEIALASASDARLLAEQLPDAMQIGKRWSGASVEDKHRWLGALIERIEVDKPRWHPKTGGFDRERLRILWRA